MQFADRPNRYDAPGQCIVIPGRVHDPNGGVALDGAYDGARGDIRLWLSHAGLHAIVRQFGNRLGLAERGELETAQERLALAEAELDRSEAQVAELAAKLDRVNGVAKDGFKIVRQQGAPKRKAAV